MRFRNVRWPGRLLGSLAAVVAIAVFVPLGQAGATGSRARSHGHGVEWVSAWAASPQGPYPSGIAYDPLPLDSVFPAPAQQANDQTLRLVVHTAQGGPELRLRLSNLDGTQPVTFGDVTVGARSTGATIVPGTLRTVLFGGQRSVVVEPGAEALSDPVHLRTRPQEDLGVSVFISGASGPMTWHAKAVATSYATLPRTGDHASESSGAAFTAPMRSWFFLNDIDVTVPATPETGTVVALGDSITDGTGSDVDGNDRWPDDLARRLLSAPGLEKEVVDEGIGGNKVLVDAGSGGPSALSRLARDVFSRPNVTDMVLFEGVNDIGGGATAAQVISGLEQIVAQAHAQGISVTGATITPYGGFYTTPDSIRQQVNTWIRTSGVFDHVVDFDAVVRDPTDPTRINPIYDHGDHIHLNPAGYQAIANAIPLRYFYDRPSGHNRSDG